MNVDQTPDVYEISPPPPARSATQRFLDQRRRTREIRKPLGAGALAATISIAVHVLLIGSLIWGGKAMHFKRDPNAEGAGASARESNQTPSVTMVLINLPAVTPKTAPDELLASKGMMPPDLALQILSADAKPAVPLIKLTEDEDARTVDAAGDQAERALLFGRYLGQVKARIDRAWSRPRTAIGAKEFSCQVQITQSQRGEVKEVELVRCNGDLRWQASLVAAINTASPLPAPPDPAVFVDRLSLAFDAVPYGKGSPEYGYESVIAQNVATTSQAYVSQFHPADRLPAR